MHNNGMRTTITLPDETHDFAMYYANARGLTLSAAIDELIRKAQEPSLAMEPDVVRGKNGFPMFPPSKGTLTSELVKKLEEEGFEPEKFA